MLTFLKYWSGLSIIFAAIIGVSFAIVRLLAFLSIEARTWTIAVILYLLVTAGITLTMLNPKED